MKEIFQGFRFGMKLFGPMDNNEAMAGMSGMELDSLMEVEVSRLSGDKAKPLMMSMSRAMP